MSSTPSLSLLGSSLSLHSRHHEQDAARHRLLQLANTASQHNHTPSHHRRTSSHQNTPPPPITQSILISSSATPASSASTSSHPSPHKSHAASRGHRRNGSLPTITSPTKSSKRMSLPHPALLQHALSSTSTSSSSSTSSPAPWSVAAAQQPHSLQQTNKNSSITSPSRHVQLSTPNKDVEKSIAVKSPPANPDNPLTTHLRAELRKTRQQLSHQLYPHVMLCARQTMLCIWDVVDHVCISSLQLPGSVEHISSSAVATSSGLVLTSCYRALSESQRIREMKEIQEKEKEKVKVKGNGKSDNTHDSDSNNSLSPDAIVDVDAPCSHASSSSSPDAHVTSRYQLTNVHHLLPGQCVSQAEQLPGINAPVIAIVQNTLMLMVNHRGAWSTQQRVTDRVNSFQLYQQREQTFLMTVHSNSVQLWKWSHNSFISVLQHDVGSSIVAAHAIPRDETLIVVAAAEATRVYMVTRGGASSDDDHYEKQDAIMLVCRCSLIGHLAPVTCVSSYKDRLITGSRDSNIKVWSIFTGKCELTLRGHQAAVHSVLPLGSSLISTSADGSMRSWSLSSGVCSWTGTHDKAYECMCTIPPFDEYADIEADLALLASIQRDISMEETQHTEARRSSMTTTRPTLSTPHDTFSSDTQRSHDHHTSTPSASPSVAPSSAAATQRERNQSRATDMPSVLALIHLPKLMQITDEKENDHRGGRDTMNSVKSTANTATNAEPLSPFQPFKHFFESTALDIVPRRRSSLLEISSLFSPSVKVAVEQRRKAEDEVNMMRQMVEGAYEEKTNETDHISSTQKDASHPDSDLQTHTPSKDSPVKSHQSLTSDHPLNNDKLTISTHEDDHSPEQSSIVVEKHDVRAPSPHKPSHAPDAHDHKSVHTPHKYESLHDAHLSTHDVENYLKNKDKYVWKKEQSLASGWTPNHNPNNKKVFKSLKQQQDFIDRMINRVLPKPSTSPTRPAFSAPSTAPRSQQKSTKPPQQAIMPPQTAPSKHVLHQPKINDDNHGRDRDEKLLTSSSSSSSFFLTNVDDDDHPLVPPPLGAVLPPLQPASTHHTNNKIMHVLHNSKSSSTINSSPNKQQHALNRVSSSKASLPSLTTSSSHSSLITRPHTRAIYLSSSSSKRKLELYELENQRHEQQAGGRGIRVLNLWGKKGMTASQSTPNIAANNSNATRTDTFLQRLEKDAEKRRKKLQEIMESKTVYRSPSPQLHRAKSHKLDRETNRSRRAKEELEKRKYEKHQPARASTAHHSVARSHSVPASRPLYSPPDVARTENIMEQLIKYESQKNKKFKDRNVIQRCPPSQLMHRIAWTLQQRAQQASELDRLHPDKSAVSSKHQPPSSSTSKHRTPIREGARARTKSPTKKSAW